MYTAQGYIRDYDRVTDTATVELTGLGVIDAWLDGLKIDAPVSRAFMTHNTPCTVSFPDEHRLCEGIVISVQGNPTTPANTQKVQTGTGYIQTNGAGTGNTTVFFPSAYTAAPQVVAWSDENYSLSIVTVTTTTVTLALGGARAFGYVHFTWQAIGT